MKKSIACWILKKTGGLGFPLGVGGLGCSGEGGLEVCVGSCSALSKRQEQKCWLSTPEHHLSRLPRTSPPALALGEAT